MFSLFFLFSLFSYAQELEKLSARKYHTPKEVIKLREQWPQAKTPQEKFKLIKKFRRKYPKSVVIHQIYQDYFKRLTQRERKELISEYEKLMNNNPKNPMFYYLYGRALNNSSSLKYFKKSIQLNKNYYWGYISLGYYYSNIVKQPNYKKAIEYFYKAIKIDNSNPAGFLNLAGIYEKQGNIDNAGEMYELLLICDPDNNYYFEKSLERYFLKGNYEKAINLLENRIKKYPEKRFIHLLGQLYYQEKNYKKCIKYLSQITRDEREINYTAHAMLCIAYAQIGKKEKALDSFEKALLSPNLYFNEEIFNRKEFDLIRNEPRFKKAIKDLKEKYGIDKPAKDFSLIALKGEKIKLKELKGKVVLLDFWATWCEPCIREMPFLKKLYKEFKGKDFAFIGLNLDENKDDVEKFIKKEGIEWPQIWIRQEPTNNILKSYQVKALPSTFLIDKRGILRNINLRGEALKKAIEKLIKE
jgi:thiol-disulfide isomerase/thioredoxin